ncbi:30S ribosomal protein S4 [Desulfoplanes formicivorans]|uniref:Small ribosomal subunit protein uS4 n=1 Tax=Desulfoplanes formicivorans TaxID=1592317 RepID=A0A194ABH9_9BACT|nr:30S ribosomal protein S4 [Desulfoplanes formicivorans]GAU07522.1 30S ribosomal protein S4 [Desulfoplanes formicivorans]
MSRYTGAKCKLCRREGEKLFLKGDRCYTDKCAFERRSYPPGEHGKMRRKPTEYAIQLREKQKVRRMYGVLEGQFRHYFKVAESKKGIAGTNLLMLLEKRIDNVAYRMGFANSRNQARQLVRHGHFMLNGRKVTVPSIQLREGDVLEVCTKSKNSLVIKEAQEVVARRGVPAWLDVDVTALKGTVKALPVRDDVTFPMNEQLIVELYSK